jgi:GT2 family glycosyltransferase
MSRPDVSVIVICRNEVNDISRCLDAILLQDAGPTAEIIVVDGMSTDGSADLIRSRYAGRVKLIENHEQYTPHAINAGIKEAGGGFIAIVGARSVLSKNYLAECVGLLNNDPSIWCTGGRIIHKGQDRISESIAAAMSSVTGVGFLNFRTLSSTRRVDTVSSPVFRKSAIDKTGHFDENCIRNQDDDYSYRMIKAGGVIVQNGNTFSEYFVRRSYAQLSAQYFQYGFWKIFVNRKHHTITSFRQIFPALLILSLLIFFLISFRAGLALSVIYLAGIAISALFAVIRHRCAVVPVMISTLIMHFSYGSAYLYGIWLLAILNRPIPQRMKAITRETQPR